MFTLHTYTHTHTINQLCSQGRTENSSLISTICRSYCLPAEEGISTTEAIPNLLLRDQKGEAYKEIQSEEVKVKHHDIL